MSNIDEFTDKYSRKTLNEVLKILLDESYTNCINNNVLCHDKKCVLHHAFKDLYQYF